MGRLNEIFRSVLGFPSEPIGSEDLPRNIHEDFQQDYGHNFGQGESRGCDQPLFHDQPLFDGQPFFHSPPGGDWSPYDGHDQEPDEFVITIEGPEVDEMFGDIEGMFSDFFQGFGFGHHGGDNAPPHFFSGPFFGPGSPHGDITITPPEDDQERMIDSPRQGGSLRDRMLKHPEEDKRTPHQLPDQDDQETFPKVFNSPHSWFEGLWRSPLGDIPQPQDKVDKDLDSEVENGQQSLDDILSCKENPTPPPTRSQGPSSSSSSFAFSSSTRVDSNGRSESKTTRRDSSGNEEVIVTRRIGDQEHIVRHHKDGSGGEETEENLVNIDESNLSEFDDQWNSPQNGNQRPSPPMLGDGRHPGSSPISSLVENIMERFFPRPR